MNTIFDQEKESDDLLFRERDQIALMAMQSLLASGNYMHTMGSGNGSLTYQATALAECCYDVADAMLKASLRT